VRERERDGEALSLVRWVVPRDDIRTAIAYHPPTIQDSSARSVTPLLDQESLRTLTHLGSVELDLLTPDLRWVQVWRDWSFELEAIDDDDEGENS